MNRDLFLATLSMDSYHRGYGQHITGLDDSAILRDAKNICDSLDAEGSRAAA